MSVLLLCSIWFKYARGAVVLWSGTEAQSTQSQQVLAAEFAVLANFASAFSQVVIRAGNLCKERKQQGPACLSHLLPIAVSCYLSQCAKVTRTSSLFTVHGAQRSATRAHKRMTMSLPRQLMATATMYSSSSITHSIHAKTKH